MAKKINTIKLTERKIKNGTNIHGRETPEDLFQKREIKIQTIDNEISKGIVEALKATPEECQKKVSHIKGLQKTTNEEISNILQEFSKITINELRRKTKNKIRDSLEKKIQENFDICEDKRKKIMETEEDVNDLKRSKSERENSQKIINELAKRFKITKNNTVEIISLLENDSFSQEILKKLQGYEAYIKNYYPHTK
ncbi:hypothetical protein P148_SR1C00001G0758 [candidate division SR1 bacterium RAAC1_SR1_1]|nr:hypothetical protein P148_SR1C00001G0758 [candidate division SR1 bacterium RAAC1_SR1_1]